MAIIIHVNVNGISTVCVFQEFDRSLELDTFLVYYFLVPKLGMVPIKNGERCECSIQVQNVLFSVFQVLTHLIPQDIETCSKYNCSG